MNWLMKLLGKASPPQRVRTSAEQLAHNCPKEFYNSSNPWTTYAGQMLFHGKGPEEWKWKFEDEKLKEKYISILTDVMNNRRIRPSAIIAVIAWKLSEMLSEPPQYIL